MYRTQRVPLSVWIKMVLSIALIITLFFAVGLRLTNAQSGKILTISGNSDQVVFTTNWDPVSPLPMFWGVSGVPMQAANINIVNRQAVIVPPTDTVSLFFNQPSIVVSTSFTPLTNDGWYAVPAAIHTITVTGNTNMVTFTANYTPTIQINVTWGVSGIPAVTQPLTFSNRTATIIPPTNTVSMLFAPPDMIVNTTLTNLGSGWYAVPPLPPIEFTHFCFLPILRR